MTETISVNVSPEVAERFRKASPGERLFWAVLFEEKILESMRSFEAISADLNQQATANGLTEAVLAEF